MKMVTGIGPCDEESPQNRRNIAFVFLGGRQQFQETEWRRLKCGASCEELFAVANVQVTRCLGVVVTIFH